MRIKPPLLLCWLGIHKKYELHFPHGDFEPVETVIVKCSRCWKTLKTSIESMPPPHHPNCLCQIIPEEDIDE